MKRAKKGGRKGGLRIETQFTFNQFEVFEGSTKGVQRDIEESAKCKKAREEGGSKSREKGNSLRCFPAGGIFLMVPREFSRTGHVYYTYRGTSIIRNLVIRISDYLNIFVIRTIDIQISVSNICTLLQYTFWKFISLDTYFLCNKDSYLKII